MDFEQLEQILKDSLNDLVLDGNEKRALKHLAKDFSDVERGFMRNRAFDLVRHGVELQPEQSQRYLSWLQQVVKAIRSVSPSQTSQVFFSPGQECRQALVELCNNAKHSIDVCVFTISDNPLRDALLAAHRRKVKLRVISDNDKSGDMGSDVDELAELGVPVKLDDSPHHMHHKFALFDQRILVNGSFNWTRSASERNQENIMLLSDASLIAQYSKKFEQLWASY